LIYRDGVFHTLDGTPRNNWVSFSGACP
jgi:hypothetical protein